VTSIDSALVDSAGKECDLLVINARLLTMDRAFTVFDNGYLAVSSGRITGIGTGSPPWTGARTIDARGAITLPGLVNSHTHLAMTLFRGVADDVDLQGFLSIVWVREKDLLSAETVRLGATAAIAESLLCGVTTAADMYFYPEETIASADALGMRVVCGPVFFDGITPENRDFDSQLRAARAWFERDPGLALGHAVCPHSTYTLREEQLRAVGDLAAEFGALVHVHAAENSGEIESVRGLHGGRSPVRVLHDTGLLTERTLLAHAVHLDDDDLDLVEASGAGVAHCPGSNMKLASGVARIPAISTRGIAIGIGTDSAASSNDLDLFPAMRTGGLLHALTSGPGAVPARDLVAMATIGGATALGLHREIGSLEVGKRADFVVMEADSLAGNPAPDPYSAIVYALSSRDVREVVVQGSSRVSDGTLSGVDVGALARELRQVSRR
jgi:5-methylthioadenosine/S-adenosylhomocysteine deaminase